MAIKLLNLEEAAAFLRMDPGQLRQMAVCGDIPCVYHGERLFFEHEELDNWFSRRLINHQPISGASNGKRKGNDNGFGADLPPIYTFCSVETICADLPGKTKPAILRALTDLSEKSGLLYDPREFMEELKKREDVASTAMAEGVALVHPEQRDEYICEAPFIALGRTAQPIFFGNQDGVATDLFFVIAGPDNAFHLGLLARLCQLISTTPLLQLLREATDENDMYEALRSVEASASSEE